MDRLTAGLVGLALVGCRPGPRPPNVPDAPTLGPVAIASLDVACDLDEEQWVLEAEATSWTGNGVLWMSRDADYVEAHPVPSVLAAEDGSFDRLRVALSIEADVHAVEPGRSTAFLCAEEPAWLFAVRDRQGAWADCRIVQPSVWVAVDPELEIPDCSTLWVPEDSGG